MYELQEQESVMSRNVQEDGPVKMPDYTISPKKTDDGKPVDLFDGIEEKVDEENKDSEGINFSGRAQAISETPEPKDNKGVEDL